MIKVTAHLDCANGRENMLQLSDLRQMDGWKNGGTDGQTDHYRSPTDWGPNNVRSSIKNNFGHSFCQPEMNFQKNVQRQDYVLPCPIK